MHTWSLADEPTAHFHGLKFWDPWSDRIAGTNDSPWVLNVPTEPIDAPDASSQLLRSAHSTYLFCLIELGLLFFSQVVVCCSVDYWKKLSARCLSRLLMKDITTSFACLHNIDQIFQKQRIYWCHCRSWKQIFRTWHNWVPLRRFYELYMVLWRQRPSPYRCLLHHSHYQVSRKFLILANFSLKR